VEGKVDIGPATFTGRPSKIRARLGPRLALASVAAFLVAVPFTMLLVLVETSFPPLYRLDRDVAYTLHAWALDHPAVVTLLDLWTDAFSPESWRIAVILAAAWLMYRGEGRQAALAVTTYIAGGQLGLGV
jgi:undecaprenyl-diphosphatase